MRSGTFLQLTKDTMDAAQTAGRSQRALSSCFDILEAESRRRNTNDEFISRADA